jgi:hypothetical protein
VVAKSAALSLQLDWNPYQVPSSTGCLSFDASWSCSHDTAVDATGKAATIKAEAGFFDIPLDNYTADSTNRTSPEHRIWYAFQPARILAKSQPLAVFFNGGPGAATSNHLFAFNTAEMTLDPNDPNTQSSGTNGATGIASNPNSWTKFANVLYIDAPATGFSYPLAYVDASGSVVKPDIGIDMRRDAGIFLQVITRFLVRHPVLLGNRVILVPESYGGTRATLMLIYLYNYASLTNSSANYQDSQVLDDLNTYFSATFGTTQPDATKQIWTRFGHQVMIEPLIVGSKQFAFELRDWLSIPSSVSHCYDKIGPDLPCSRGSGPILATCDQYDCDMVPGWANGQADKAAKNLNNVATLKVALGVDPTTIDWMHTRYRALAYGRSGGLSTDSMKNAFNDYMFPLEATDSYFVDLNGAVGAGYGQLNEWNSTDHTVGYYFLGNVQAGVATFITVAQYDQAIWSPAIAEALSDLAVPNDPNNPSQANPDLDAGIAGLVSNVSYSPGGKTAHSPSDLLGSMSITYKSPAATLSVTMPTSYPAGHSVTMRTPAALLADVIQWYSTY